jgi:tellurite resistance protein TehA-like permease
MATGIVSIAAADEGRRWLSLALLVVAAALYIVLVVRAARHRAVSVESFALVAATSVLAARLAVAGERPAALGLWAIALGFWAVVCLGLRSLGPRTGLRLLASVATQSLAVAGVLSLPALGWVALVFFATGLTFYMGLIVTWSPSDLRTGGGDVWITMGALAISALAAASLAGALHGLDLDEVALALWAAATAWLPLLLYAELRWRRPGYEPRRWATVFPLGMYAAASHAVGQAAGVRPVLVLAVPALWVALAAWLLVATAALRRVTLVTAKS